MTVAMPHVLALLLSASSLAVFGAGCRDTSGPEDSSPPARADLDTPAAREKFDAPFVFTIDVMRKINGAL